MDPQTPPQLRLDTVELLKGASAHLDFDRTVADFPANSRHLRPRGSAHSGWELLEHLRIAQRDILDYIRDGRHQSPEFPKGYWPLSPQPPNDDAWNRAAQNFRDDLASLIAIANDAPDLLAQVPHQDAGHTILRGLMLAADHNSYHVGQLAALKKLL